MNKKIDIYKTQKKKLNIENPKKVSVIIPNYNYQKYIIERIDSILLQTYPIYEIIILDDCSTDNSVQIIEDKIKTIPENIKVQFIKNEKNSGGCVFKQWKKGFDAATGDFIWIAEADDSAESTFVEELIKPFDDEEVVLSYCESARIDGENNLIREKSDDLYDMCRTGEWGKSYIWTGREENIYHLSVTNTILNVSSVMWRKKDYTEIFKEAGEYKVAGDWRGSDLKYYKIGKGPNVLFATFSIHGFEDSYSNDGQELVYIAEQFKNYMQNSSGESIINNWTVYIFPCLNPDGAYHGWTNNGPGRTTLYSAAPGNKGIDMNRNWSVSGESYPRYNDDRNYNGTSGFESYESRYLRDFLLSHKSSLGQTLLIDLHGWLNETIGDNGLGGFYRSQFGISTHIGSYGRGYLVNWARKSLGNGNRTARSALIELPQVYSHQDTLNRNYAQKYINATINMLKGV